MGSYITVSYCVSQYDTWSWVHTHNSVTLIFRKLRFEVKLMNLWKIKENMVYPCFYIFLMLNLPLCLPFLPLG